MSHADFHKAADPQHKGMTPREIRAELVIRGITIKEIAEAAGVTSGAVTQAISQYEGSRYKGYRVREFIARALDRDVHEIWPDHRKVV